MPAVTEGVRVPFAGGQFLRLFAYFAVGSAAYLYRERVPLHGGLLTLALAVSALLLAADPRSALLPVTLGYATVFLAMSPLPRPPGFRRGDYSYGVYIYAFPIQQTVALLMPRPMEWTTNLAVALPLTLACGALSWHLVEHPALRLKRRDQASAPTADPFSEPSAARGRHIRHRSI
jgi:peptidoglycan/LPS O-acetylase OafA/YrhL